MNIKDILADKRQSSVPLFKADNYTNVYKKTEKIVCAVFLLTEEVQQKSQSGDVVKDVREYAKAALVSVTHLLSTDAHDEVAWSSVVRNLSTLRSLLFVLVASRMLKSDLADILTREIDGVMQNISLGNVTFSTGSLAEEVPLYVEDERRRVRPSHLSRPRTTPVAKERRVVEREEGVLSRRDAVLAVIRQKEVVTIKDISESITNCSEKTIQRELMDLIKDGIIAKEGERRWSKYRIIS